MNSEHNNKGPIERDTHVVIVGLGKSGRSAIEFCLAKHAKISLSDASLSLDDSETIKWLEDRGVKYETWKHSEELFFSADLILISPGVPFDLPILNAARAKKIPVMGELALAPYYMRTPILAVTGTNGKTTVTTLLGEIFSKSGFKVFVGGNIGTPLTDYLAGEQEADWAILEVSSFQLDAAGGFRPDIGILLNISPDHLDRYDSMEKYALSKMNIFAQQSPNDKAIMNYDDIHCREISAKLSSTSVNSGKIYFFGKQERRQRDSEFGNGKVWLTGKNFSDSVEEYDLHGTNLEYAPNLENGAAAILAARLAGCAKELIEKAVKGFVPLPHRMSLVGEINGVRFLNDSKATNIGAVISALSAIEKPVVLIAGGRDKGGEYSLMSEAVKNKVKSMLLIGEAREKMAAIFNELTSVELFESLEQAVFRSAELACPGDVVLLSPACASFDMFSGYSERGNVFQQLVEKLRSPQPYIN